MKKKLTNCQGISQTHHWPYTAGKKNEKMDCELVDDTLILCALYAGICAYASVTLLKKVQKEENICAFFLICLKVAERIKAWRVCLCL